VENKDCNASSYGTSESEVVVKKYRCCNCEEIYTEDEADKLGHSCKKCECDLDEV
jgi:hypothetical protein